MRVGALKEAAKKKDPDYEKKYGKRLVKWQLMMFLLTGNPGEKPPKGTSPKRKKVPVKPKPKPSPKTKTKTKTKRKRTPSPRRKSKGKERVAEQPAEIGIPPKTEMVGEVSLEDWTALGELNPLFLFLKGFESLEDLIERIKQGIADTPEVKGSENIVRFEPDPTCDVETGTCGAQALGVVLQSGSYDLFAEFTAAKYLKQLYIGPYTLLDKAKTKADFGLLKTFVVANLSDLKSLVDRYSSAEELLADMGRDNVIVKKNIAIISNPSTAKRTNLMNVHLATNGKGEYRGIHITRS